MLQWIGAGVLIAVSVMTAIEMYKKEKDYLQLIRSTTVWFETAERKIQLFNVSASELLKECPFRILLESEEEYRGFSKKETDSLKNFLKDFGKQYREDTLRLCADQTAEWRNRLLNGEKNYPARLKMVTSIPILSALSAIILIF